MKEWNNKIEQYLIGKHQMVKYRNSKASNSATLDSATSHEAF